MNELDNYENFGIAVDVIKVATICIEYAMKAKEQDPDLDLPSLTELSIVQATLEVGSAITGEIMKQKGEDVSVMDFYEMFDELGGSD